MNIDSAWVFADMFGQIDVFMLVMVRILGFMIMVPVISGQTIPMASRMAFAFVCSIVVMTSGSVVAPESLNLLDYFFVILNEFTAGFLIGFTVSLMFSIFHMIGQQTDYQIGFTMVSVQDPITQVQTPITGNLIYFTFLVFFVTQGGFTLIMMFTLSTYHVIPVGNAFILGNSDLVFTILNMLGTYLDLGLRFSLPIIAVITVINVALGILVKAVPQMNVFVVGLPTKVAVGLMGIMMLVPFWYDAIYTPFTEILYDNIIAVVNRMMR